MSLLPLDNAPGSAGIVDGGGILKEQWDFVMNHIKSNLDKGTYRYILSKAWFDRWKSYVDVSRKPIMRRGKPDAIDNSSLLVNGSLREYLNEDIEYVILPEIVWDKLVEWYGVKNQQEPLKFPVVEAGHFPKELRVEVYPLSLNLSHYKNLSLDNVQKFSRNVTLGHLIKHMRELFSVDNSKEVKLVTKMFSTYEDLVDETKTLGVLGLPPKADVVIVEKEGNEWAFPVKFEASVKKSRISDVEPSSSIVDDPNVSNRAQKNSDFISAFSSISVQEPQPSPKKGVCGLRNLGNKSFINSALQCLSNIPELTEFFLGELWKKDLNGTKGDLVLMYAELIKAMWDGKSSTISSDQYEQFVMNLPPEIREKQPPDSMETLEFLLEGLHEGLNRVRQNLDKETMEAQGRPGHIVEKESSDDYLKMNSSKITDLFHGQLRSEFRCPKCSSISITFNPFNYLSIPLPNEMDFEFMFISNFSTEIPIKYRIKIPKNCTVGTAIGILSKVLKVPNEMLKISTINRDIRHGSNFKRFLENNKPLKALADEQMVVYKINPAKGNVIVGVYLRNKELNFGIPILISVPGKLTYEQLRKHVLEQYSRVQKDVRLARKEPLGISFNVSKVSQYGTRAEKLKEDSPISLSNNEILAVEFNIENLPEPVISASCKFNEDESVKSETQSKASVELSDCLTCFTSEEQLGENSNWYCHKCKENVQAYKKFDLWKLPKYLVIQLKRFQTTANLREKLDIMVNYPIEDLNLSACVLGDKQKYSYNLIAVNNHVGGLNGGHYTVHARNYLLNEWYKFDDSNVTSPPATNAVSKNAYILVYERNEEK